MRVVLAVAADLLREAASRKWFLALGAALTLVLGVIAIGLRLDVIDGALAASKLFGRALGTDIQAVDVALRPVFAASSYLVSYLGTALLVLACADFAPSLLAPGRIEHLLSLPVRRWELLAGTFLGVWLIALAAALYGAVGLSVILGVKTGTWTAGPITAAVLSSVTFATLYASMLATAVFVRSAAVSAAAGGVVFVAGIIASYRGAVSEAFDEGVGRQAFLFVSSFVPRVGSIADAAADLAGSAPVASGALFRMLVGMGVFTLAMLSVAIWRFEEKDY